MIEGSMLRMFTPRFFEVGKDVIDQIVQGFLTGGGPGFEPDVDAILAQLDALDKHDTLAELPSISCPTLVTGSKQDQMVPGFAAEEIAAAIPGAELVMFETGHGAPLEEMSEFNAAITAFLTKVNTGSS
jgi:pimeloyl-ACP methyl ester carboxylesterase